MARRPQRRRVARRVRRGFGGSRRGFALVPRGVLPVAATAAAGFIGVQLAMSRLPYVSTLAPGLPKAAAKAGVGIGAYMLMRRVSPTLSRGLLIGALTSAVLDAIGVVWKGAAGGAAGYGYLGSPDSPTYMPWGYGQLDADVIDREFIATH